MSHSSIFTSCISSPYSFVCSICRCFFCVTGLPVVFETIEMWLLLLLLYITVRISPCGCQILFLTPNILTKNVPKMSTVHTQCTAPYSTPHQCHKSPLKLQFNKNSPLNDPHPLMVSIIISPSWPSFLTHISPPRKNFLLFTAAIIHYSHNHIDPYQKLSKLTTTTLSILSQIWQQRTYRQSSFSVHSRYSSCFLWPSIAI